MKIDPHSSLLAAQQMRTLQNGRAANGSSAAQSAQFLAELQARGMDHGQTNTQNGQIGQPGGRLQAAMARRPAASQPGQETQSGQSGAQTGQSMPQREAPLKATRPDRPLPPGSLLNIVV